MKDSTSVKVYHGYGHSENLIVFGHVFKYKAKNEQCYSNNIWTNIKYLFRLFLLKPYPFVHVRLHFYGQVIDQKTERDGFFRIEWAAAQTLEAGLHLVTVEALDNDGNQLAVSDGKVYIPHSSQYAIISDVDDTVMVSHSATIGRRLRELFIKNPHTRKTFVGVSKHYTLLAEAYAEPGIPNPFFYVSSSEWNLYEYLKETFRFNKLPEGSFLLNSIKQWKQLIHSGKTGHMGKLLRIVRILDAFPNQMFILFGDNSQSDPIIYEEISEKYSGNLAAVYIRNVRPSRAAETCKILLKIESRNVPVCLFNDSFAAIKHSEEIGLLNLQTDISSVVP